MIAGEVIIVLRRLLQLRSDTGVEMGYTRLKAPHHLGVPKALSSNSTTTLILRGDLKLQTLNLAANVAVCLEVQAMAIAMEDALMLGSCDEVWFSRATDRTIVFFDRVEEAILDVKTPNADLGWLKDIETADPFQSGIRTVMVNTRLSYFITLPLPDLVVKVNTLAYLQETTEAWYRDRVVTSAVKHVRVSQVKKMKKRGRGFG
ncbi:hypothetical protein BSLG_001905 [Batrachochytrium salamandrivorans]|nr:hypothetical protein BSLG_001905 [Batrachochytrium salamandrivorans]